MLQESERDFTTERSAPRGMFFIFKGIRFVIHGMRGRAQETKNVIFEINFLQFRTRKLIAI